MTTPVQIPADVDREDRLLGDLTARQLIILTTAAVAVYLVWMVTGPTALIVFAVAAAPLGVVGLVLAFWRRDGVSADRLLWAALTQRRHTPRAPHRPAAASAAGVADPDPRRAAAERRRGRPRTAGAGRPVVAQVPARRVLAADPDLGVVDLGRDGWAVVCAVSPVNITLRSGPERDVLLAGFARWLHSLAAPVQILTRTHPEDLSATITGLRHAAARLPHPALAAAASAHADHLHELGSAAQLLHREFLIVFRTPTPNTAARARRGARASSARPVSAGANSAAQTAVGETAPDRAPRSAFTQLRRRAEEAVGLLGGIGLRVTPLDPAEATRVLQSAMRPELGAARGAGLAAPGLNMPGSPPRPAVAQPHAAHGSSTFGGLRSPRNAAHRGGIRPHSLGVGVADEPTIELDLTAATAVPTAVPSADRARSRSCAGSAINADRHRAAGSGRDYASHAAALSGTVDAAADLAADHDDDEIERANITGAEPAEPAAHDESDDPEAFAIAATITAALTPHALTECATATDDGAHDGDVAVAEDMTLDGDEHDACALILEEGSRHDAANHPETPPAGHAPRRASHPTGGSNRGGSPGRAPARRAPRASRGPAPRSTGSRP
jgi:hypothetical protein